MLIGAAARRTDIQKGFLVAAASAVLFLSLIVVRGFVVDSRP
jgi:hypothetical protein